MFFISAAWFSAYSWTYAVLGWWFPDNVLQPAPVHLIRAGACWNRAWGLTLEDVESYMNKTIARDEDAAAAATVSRGGSEDEDGGSAGVDTTSSQERQKTLSRTAREASSAGSSTSTVAVGDAGANGRGARGATSPAGSSAGAQSGGGGTITTGSRMNTTTAAPTSSVARATTTPSGASSSAAGSSSMLSTSASKSNRTSSSTSGTGVDAKDEQPRRTAPAKVTGEISAGRHAEDPSRPGAHPPSSSSPGPSSSSSSNSTRKPAAIKTRPANKRAFEWTYGLAYLRFLLEATEAVVDAYLDLHLRVFCWIFGVEELPPSLAGLLSWIRSFFAASPLLPSRQLPRFDVSPRVGDTATASSSRGRPADTSSTSSANSVAREGRDETHKQDKDSGATLTETSNSVSAGKSKAATESEKTTEADGKDEQARRTERSLPYVVGARLASLHLKFDASILPARGFVPVMPRNTTIMRAKRTSRLIANGFPLIGDYSVRIAPSSSGPVVGSSGGASGSGAAESPKPKRLRPNSGGLRDADVEVNDEIENEYKKKQKAEMEMERVILTEDLEEPAVELQRNYEHGRQAVGSSGDLGRTRPRPPLTSSDSGIAPDPHDAHDKRRGGSGAMSSWRDEDEEEEDGDRDASARADTSRTLRSPAALPPNEVDQAEPSAFGFGASARALMQSWSTWASRLWLSVSSGLGLQLNKPAKAGTRLHDGLLHQEEQPDDKETNFGSGRERQGHSGSSSSEEEQEDEDPNNSDIYLSPRCIVDTREFLPHWRAVPLESLPKGMRKVLRQAENTPLRPLKLPLAAIRGGRGRRGGGEHGGGGIPLLGNAFGDKVVGNVPHEIFYEPARGRQYAVVELQPGAWHEGMVWLLSRRAVEVGEWTKLSIVVTLTLVGLMAAQRARDEWGEDLDPDELQ